MRTVKSHAWKLLTVLARLSYREERLARWGGSIIQYLSMNDQTGTTAADASRNARNGAYSATGITLAQAGIGNGKTSCVNDGTGYINAYSAALAAAFNGAAGSIGGWWKIDAVGTWADATNRRLFTFSADGSNRVYLTKSSTTHILTYIYQAGTATQTVNLSTADPVTWVHLFLTWDKAANAVKAYYNGAQTGTTQTGLDTWAGSLASTTSVYGAASTTPSAVNKSSMQEWLILSRAATASEILADYKLP